MSPTTCVYTADLTDVHLVTSKHRPHAFLRQFPVDAIGVQHMRDDLYLMTARNELKAAVGLCGRIERQLEVERLGLAVTPQAVVLVAGGGAAGARRLNEAIIV